ncbi:MAG: phosphotransferase [Corynebacterium sp.]|nr:phosphotransferase [Corynebacterium sp.]
MDTSILLRALFDDQGRAELLGRETTITQVRIKPESAIVLGLSDNRWARVLWPNSHGHAQRVAQWAQHHDLWQSTTWLSPEILLQQGELKADEELAPHLINVGFSAEVLRYIPSRRVVLKHGNHVIQVSHRQLPHHRITGVPTPRKLGPTNNPHLTVHEFVGNQDLSTAHAPELDTAAGMLFAQLHRLAPPEAPSTNVFRQVSALAQLFRYLNPVLAARLNWVTGRLEDLGRKQVFSHGDATPAQVLTDGSQLWLTNFERACGNPVAVDVGSYVENSDPAAGERFIAGYQAGGGKLPNARTLRHAQAQAKLLHIGNPLRQAHLDWETEIFAELDAVKELLA